MTSWKTTLFGLLAGIGAAVAMVDGIPHWLLVSAKVAAAAGVAGLGLAARDNDKSSEDVGANKPTAVPIRGIALSLFLALGLAGVMVGCSGTPARIAYNTVAAPAITVDQAMTAWGDYVAQFHPSVATELKVKAAFETYQKAELVAIDAAQAYAALSSSGSTNTVMEKLQSDLTSQAAATALADLVNLLQSIGVKL